MDIVRLIDRFMEISGGEGKKMSSLSDPGDPRDLSLQAFQVHPVDKRLM